MAKPPSNPAKQTLTLNHSTPQAPTPLHTPYSTTATPFPPPASFTSEHIRHLTCPSTSPYSQPPPQRAEPHTYRPVHTALVPALLFVPAYYVPAHTPCDCCKSEGEGEDVETPAASSASDSGSETGAVLDVETAEMYVGGVLDSDSASSETGEYTPWFRSAAEQFKESVGEVDGERWRGRDGWECDFCGATENATGVKFTVRNPTFTLFSRKSLSTETLSNKPPLLSGTAICSAPASLTAESSMSIHAIIDDIKQGGAADDDFMKQLRAGMNTILDGMQEMGHRRGDAMCELEEELRDGGHLDHSDLVSKIRALEEERAASKKEIETLRLNARTTPHQNESPAGLSNKRKKALARMINNSISQNNDAHVYIKSRANSMITEAGESHTIILDLENAEQESRIIHATGNPAAAQDLRYALRRSVAISKRLLEGGKSISKNWDTQNDRTWDIFREERALTRQRIDNLRKLALELGLNMKLISEDSTL
ncbi:hypothetical protein C7974DRAFT_474962 [Boeremia exigua]|uniref:uncharacterized protein n=1 Tax=Boeremia exigua TaxID=749465 RepID=UPI001E8D68D1|nr:uncharacterized protein C7974DRAFT_474962 [Boeremia exigua]KAH6616496.1 hypothetical protein C7974DRAFT_474962 [Boeremia exigua]